LGLPKHIRLKLLQNATFVHYPSSGIIYNEGDLSDKMYIIIRGSVNIRKKARTSYGSIENLIATTLYDGQYFGDCTNYHVFLYKVISITCLEKEN